METLVECINKMLNEFDKSFDFIKTTEIREYISSDKFNADEIITVLQPYESQLTSVESLKTKDLLFMNNIILFGGLLKFSKFRPENKSTKKIILGHLKVIYLVAKATENPERVLNELVSPQQQIGHLPKELLENKHLMEIAEKITRQMKRDNVDPANLLTSIMTGNMSGVSNIISSIEQSLEEKFQEGTLNKEELEKQSKNIIENFKK